MYLYNLHTKSRPALVHKNGKNIPREIIQLYENIDWNPKCTLTDCTVLTWNSHPNTKGDAEKSLDKAGIPYRVLGKEPWRNSDKIRYVLEQEINSTYVMCLDCYDVKIVDDLARCVNRLKELGCRALYAAEKSFYHRLNSEWRENTKKFEQQKFGSTAYPYLNSGMMVAETDFCRHMFQEYETILTKYDSQSDQTILHQVLMNLWPDMMIDNECQVFQCLAHVFAGEIVAME